MTATLTQAGLETAPPPAPALPIGTCYGWYDPDKKKPTAVKVRDAAKAFRAKFKRDPVRVLTSCVDVQESTEIDGMTVTPHTFISAGVFYVAGDQP